MYEELPGDAMVKAGNFHAQVVKIIPEPDEYETDSGKVMTDSEFWKGNAKAKDVKRFKRFRCRLEVSDTQGTDKCEVLISARGNIVTVTRPKKLSLSTRGLTNALKAIAERFDYHTAASAYYPHDDRGVPKGLAPLDPLPDPDKEYAVVGDAYWFADVLHHVRDAGGFNGRGEIGPR